MEPPVLPVCNYVIMYAIYDVICSYDTDRVGYTGTSALKYNLDTLYFK